MRCLVFFISIFICSCAWSQRSSDTNYIRSGKIRSAILKEDRFFDLYMPQGFRHTSMPNTCPVIYVLDGVAHFSNTVSIMQQLSKSNSALSNYMVVGVGNIWQRDRDYTPTHVDASKFVPQHAATVSGGGQNFIAFLKEELIPFISSKYSSGSRIIVGHSLGGLIACDMLLNNASMFDGYALIDPSMWWDNQALLQQSKKILAAKRFNNLRVFVAVANTATKSKADLKALQTDTSSATALIRPAASLIDNLVANKTNGLTYESKYYPQHDHMSVYSTAAYDALKFLLAFFSCQPFFRPVMNEGS